MQPAVVADKRTRTRIDVKKLLDAATLLGVSSQFAVETVSDHLFVRHCDDDTTALLSEATKVVRRTGRRVIEHWGVARIEDVVTEVQRECKEAVESSFVEKLLQYEEGFRWLDQENGWFWNASVPRNRLLNQIEKVLAVADHLSVSELCAAVCRNYRMEGLTTSARRQGIVRPA